MWNFEKLGVTAFKCLSVVIGISYAHFEDAFRVYNLTSKISIRTKANHPLRDRNQNTLPFDSIMTLTLR